MQDFELASIALIAWVLLYHDSYSRARMHNRVECYQTRYVTSFKLENELSSKGVSIRDEHHHFAVHNVGDMQRHEFRIEHDWRKNEFLFKRRSDTFEVEDKYGNRMTVKITSDDDVKIVMRTYPEAKYVYRIS